MRRGVERFAIVCFLASLLVATVLTGCEPETSATPARGTTSIDVAAVAPTPTFAPTQTPQPTPTPTLNDRFAALAAALELPEPPARIECFDVSHTDGEATVASCVVFGPEGPVKSDYRRFNVRDVAPGDDYAAMRQALARRFASSGGDGRDEGGAGEAAPLPDLLLIDGGRGQLGRALDVLEELALTGVETAAVAKGPGRKPGFESVYRPGRASPPDLREDSPALHFIQSIRDEAHRFAITGHRSRRARRRRTSTLEALPGIGPVLRQRLLTEFGGLPGVRRAGVEDLARVRGVSPRLAREVYERLREEE